MRSYGQLALHACVYLLSFQRTFTCTHPSHPSQNSGKYINKSTVCSYWHLNCDTQTGVISNVGVRLAHNTSANAPFHVLSHTSLFGMWAFDLSTDAWWCLNVPYRLILIGIGSLIVFDVWQRVFQIFTSIPPSHWTLVGRWFIGLISSGKLIANKLSQQPEARQETPLGWIVHYVVRIAYAYVRLVLVHFHILELTTTDGFFLEWLAS